MKTLFSLNILFLFLFAAGSEARAQDPFEIQVYEYETVPKGQWSLEYYGSTGAIGDFLPSNEQVHQLFPGGDLKLSENVVWNLGIGVGMTDAGNRLVYKTRVGILFGKGH